MVKKALIPGSWFFFTLSVLFLTFPSCGYTTQSRLPEHIQSVHVKPVENAIDLSSEISDKDIFRVYRPGIEVSLTNSIINRFIFDGNMKVVRSEEADAIVETKMTDYRRDPLRYSKGDDVQEYRLSITLGVTITDVREQKILLKESNITGDTTFFISGPRTESEDVAAERAVEDVSRRVVDKMIEVW